MCTDPYGGLDHCWEILRELRYYGLPLLVKFNLLFGFTYCKEENPNDLVEERTPGVLPLEDLDSQHDGWDGEEGAADDENDEGGVALHASVCLTVCK